MLLSEYITITQSLIQTPASPVLLLDNTLLTIYINIARGQVAGQGECIPAIGTITTVPSQSSYSFSAIDFLEPDLMAGAIHIRMINWVTARGQKRLTVREWPWFNNYVIARPNETYGPPKVWTQYRQGSLGTIFINLPDDTYTLQVDTICYPVNLVDDTTPDAMPYLWTDCVPMYAAYYAYMAFQRQADADHFLQRYQQLMQRARAAVTPGVLPMVYQQGPDPMLPNRLGLGGGGGRGRQQPQEEGNGGGGGGAPPGAAGGGGPGGA